MPEPPPEWLPASVAAVPGGRCILPTSSRAPALVKKIEREYFLLKTMPLHVELFQCRVTFYEHWEKMYLTGRFFDTVVCICPIYTNDQECLPVPFSNLGI
jgi:hypothetical protein